MRKAWAEHSLGLVRPTLLEFDQWLRLQLRIQLSCEAAAPAPSQQKRTAGMFLTTKTASTSVSSEAVRTVVADVFQMFHQIQVQDDRTSQLSSFASLA
ncbi:hypothetical protein FJT64_021796 [Amphibalanus amphitrite]|uniref:Uncharacterized protein n=1 Tax=Amphibalanus amphitrite TaxID=1232801 RepID=A0A6A4WH54_AMPAM|nr:hypothetical protein FJT64_021796 [Amphibalanus amphitrite]